MPEKKLTLDTVAPHVADALNVQGCIVIVSYEDGSIGMTSHGVNHYKANELLSVGIHINLGQHDEAVRKGDAGKEAQGIQRSIDGGGA